MQSKEEVELIGQMRLAKMQRDAAFAARDVDAVLAWRAEIGRLTGELYRLRLRERTEGGYVHRD